MTDCADGMPYVSKDSSDCVADCDPKFFYLDGNDHRKCIATTCGDSDYKYSLDPVNEYT